jgi:hypothetical protein
MTKRTVILLLASLAWAQTKPSEPVPDQLVYEFKNVDFDRAGAIVTFVGQLMFGGVSILLNNTFKTAIIRPVVAGRPGAAETMAKAEDLIKHYDVAVPQVDFVAYLVQASRRGPGEGAPTGQPVPPVLQGAIAEMKKTFSYADYTLLDTLASEVHHNTVVSNMLPGRELKGMPYFYEIHYNNTNVSPDGKIIGVDPFEFTVRIPVQSGTAEYQNSGISTYLAIHEGEKLVIGKVRTGVNDTSDIFLVLTAKLR